MNAGFINGVSSHIFDYDDTHLKTIIHPAGPVMSAILAKSGCSRLIPHACGPKTFYSTGSAFFREAKPKPYLRDLRAKPWHVTPLAT
jgi:hypothetical protein